MSEGIAGDNRTVSETPQRAASHGAYPRPTLIRDGWQSLDGTWRFALDREAEWDAPEMVDWQDEILVPFAPETKQSGVNAEGFFRACWYRRSLELPTSIGESRILLHFGAVDYHATIWLGGVKVGEHEGGYTPFTFDITSLVAEGKRELVVRAYDDPHDLEQPRGKQDWEAEPHLIWYPRTSGIWQTVWLEFVPSSWISSVTLVPNIARWEIGLQVEITRGTGDNVALELNAQFRVGGSLLASDRYSMLGRQVHRRIALSDPGIDDSRNDLLWSPASPTLIDVDLELRGPDGVLVDRVRTYAALREIAVLGDRLILNGRVYQLRMVLDQGYWPDTGMTPPDDDALRRDVELAKAMGFNGVRKHQKIECPRYLYWADRLGLLVWVEMPSAYRFTPRSVRRLKRQWADVIERDMNHPCVAAWVPFNESWGVPNLPNSAEERHYVQALYHLTKTLDATRPVVGNDGWESVATDIIGIHDYDHDATRIARRYHTSEARLRLFQHERPAGRLLRIGDAPAPDHPIVLSEFGGLAIDRPGTWGYTVTDTVEAFAEHYTLLLWVVSGLEMLAGFCYTQFCDTYQEANGLLHADRTPKFPLHEMAEATLGHRPPRQWTRGEATS